MRHKIVRQRTPPSELILFWSHLTRPNQGLSLSHSAGTGRTEPWERGWWRGGKRKESLQLHLRNLNVCIKKGDAKCSLAEMTLVMTSLTFACVYNVCLHSYWLVEIGQPGQWGATGELEVEFKFQRRSCKLTPSFSSPTARAPRRACSQAKTSGVTTSFYHSF